MDDIHYRVSRKIYEKRLFDASNPEDLELAYNFIRTGRWGAKGCPFVEDWPYTNVPDMIKCEVILKYLPKIIKETRKTKTKKRV